MKSRAHFDVLIAGAGPAGTACATLLASAGLSTILFDKARFPRDKICGDCVNPASWGYFEMLGVAEVLRSLDLRPVESVRIANLRGNQIVVRVPSVPERPFFAIQRNVLDNLLLQNAIRKGTRFREETQILDATFDGTWNVLVRGKDGIEPYSCDYVIGADGRNSTVANKIGAWTRAHALNVSKKRIGIQWHADAQFAVGSEVHLYTMNDGYFGIVNIDGRSSNIAMVTSPVVARTALDSFQDFAERTVYSNPVFKRFARHIEPHDHIVTTYPINPIRRYWRAKKAYLVGDARQTVEPFTGEGIYLSLQDGVRTAHRILKTRRKAQPRQPLPVKRTFWVNKAFSPVLRNHRMTESMVSLAAKHTGLSNFFGWTVFGLAD